MYRDLSFSFAAHAALIAALLAFSATRQPARIAEVVRPVRLVTSLELPRREAGPARAARPAAPAPPAKPAERAPRPAAEPPPSRTPPAPARAVAPIAVPKFALPSGAAAPVAPPRTAPHPTESEAALRDRLARRLSAPPEERRAGTEAEAPKLARLPEASEAPPRPAAATASAATVASAPPAGLVQPVGYFPHAWYLAVLKERIFSRWAPPSEFYVGGGGVAALVSFRIDRAGRISGVTVKESSGHARFDRSALAAVQGLVQVPALPEQYAEETLDVVIRFQNE
jgi:TonB family protein